MPSQMLENKTKIIKYIVKDIVCLIMIASTLGILHFTIKPFRRGFFCTDETIRYPEKNSTISSLLLYVSGTTINILLILIFEYVKLTKNYEVNQSRESFKLVYIANVYCRIIIWLFGALSSELITDLTKVYAGRLRPHFLSVCKPEILYHGQVMNLADYCNKEEDKYKYISDYTCINERSDSRKSFMSGHSSYAAYSAIHAIIYIQTSVESKDFGLIRSFAQVILVTLAIYIGLTRISDHKHHWQDVSVGLAQGTLVAFIVIRFLWTPYYKNFKNILKLDDDSREQSRDTDQELSRVRY